MSKFNRATLRSAAAAAILGLGAACFAAPEAPSTSDQSLMYQGITKPSEQRGLNFNGPGVVAKVLVKEGDHVKKGQLIAQQDDRADQADLKTLEAKLAASDLEIDADEKEMAEKKVEWQRLEQGLARHVNSDLEVMKAKLDFEISTVRRDVAKAEKSEKNTEVDAQKAKIALREIHSTTDGIVQQINVHEGELAANDPKTPVITVVTNQPLYVDVFVPATVARTLKPNDKLQVHYTDESNDKWVPAEIIFFNPVANATTATSSQSVRLELENAEEMRAGMHVMVKLPGTPVASARDSR